MSPSKDGHLRIIPYVMTDGRLQKIFIKKKSSTREHDEAAMAHLMNYFGTTTEDDRDSDYASERKHHRVTTPSSEILENPEEFESTYGYNPYGIPQRPTLSAPLQQQMQMKHIATYFGPSSSSTASTSQGSFHNEITPFMTSFPSPPIDPVMITDAQLLATQTEPMQRLKINTQPNTRFKKGISKVTPKTRTKIKKYDHTKLDNSTATTNLESLEIQNKLHAIEILYLNKMLEVSNDTNSDKKQLYLRNKMMEAKLTVLLSTKSESDEPSDHFVEQAKHKVLEEVLAFYPAVDC